ncbi:MAG: adenylate/guanylate cyclase domain-containing protein [Solirubrobacterales bacterium]
MRTEAAPHTFLFADLVGYTALTDAEGDDHAAAVALEFQRRARELASRHGAEAVKALGDAVMLRCPGAAGGIRLGLGLVEVLASDPALPPVRVGVHSGSAVARDGDWFGHGVNVASRLCSVAGGGEVLVSEAAWEAAGELPAVELGERRLHWLKNVTEPVPARLASVRERSRRRRRWCPRSHDPLRARVA